MWKKFPLFGINLHTDTSPDTAKGGILRHLNDPNLQLATSVGFHFFPSLKRTTNSGWHYRKLGESSFVLEVLREAEERFERSYELKSRGYDIEHLAVRVADIFGVDAKAILKGGKYKEVVPARGVLCYWGVRELGASATALAQRLGMTSLL